MTETGYKYDVCLSFAAEQRAYVEQVADALEAGGLAVFRDDREDRVDTLGKDLDVFLDGVYRVDSAYCVVFVSADYVRRKWTRDELASALVRAMTTLGNYILPVRFDDTVLPGLSRSRAFADAGTTPPADLAGLLLDKVRSEPPPVQAKRARVLTPAQVRALRPDVVATELVLYDAMTSMGVLADADPAVAADVLAVLDHSTAVPPLSLMNRRIAREILEHLPDVPRARFEEVLDATAAVLACADVHRGSLGQVRTKFLVPVSSARRTGFRQDFEHGSIHWTADLGPQPTWYGIDEHHRAGGGVRGRLGFPVTAETTAAPSPAGTVGVFQRFESTWDYPPWDRAGQISFGATVYWTEQHGSQSTWGAIGACYEELGGSGGRLGFPAAPEVTQPVPSSAPGEEACYQEFERGVVFWNSWHDTCHVAPSAVFELMYTGGGMFVEPTGPAATIVSPYGTEGVAQPFTWGDSGETRATAHVSPTGLLEVEGAVDDVHRSMGGAGGILGFPTTDVDDGDVRQEFEGGAVYLEADGRPAVVVVGAGWDLVRDDAAGRRLGRPLANEEHGVQFFENGVVTVRDGVAEWWVRP